MNTSQLNLARKWRSANFDTIIGQELVVRLLKNSLYVGQLFPVYLLCGQHGCGKTTTARVFAAAVNCEKIPDFRQSPKQQVIPCGACRSCVSMQEGTHPDFIEIDAASHTGVDNVRQIIESSSLLPVLGAKKIYLIDEAHMLSKAAFNALLKVLEEPPATALFLLATTDPQKVIDTVRSRCFQLFFTAVDAQTLVQHLAYLCREENIPYEDGALELIVTESGGSVRDAINILETVRFSDPQVTMAAVQKTLGRLAVKDLHALVEVVLCETPARLLTLLEEINFSAYSAQKVYESLLVLMRSLLWAKYGVSSYVQQEELVALSARAPVQRLTTVLQSLCDQEVAFNRTTKKHLFLELLLLKLCAGENNTAGELKTPERRLVTSSSSRPVAPKVAPTNNEPARAVSSETEQAVRHAPQTDITGLPSGVAQAALAQEASVSSPESEQAVPADQQSAPQLDDPAASWQSFATEISGLSDPLLQSIFVQGNYLSIENAQVQVEFPAQLSFFEDWLKDTQAIWLPVFRSYFGESATLSMRFSTALEPKKTDVIKPVAVAPVAKAPDQRSSAVPSAPAQRTSFARRPARFTKKPVIQEGKPVDVSDAQTWQKTNLVLKYFPGTVVNL